MYVDLTNSPKYVNKTISGLVELWCSSYPGRIDYRVAFEKINTGAKLVGH